MRSLQKFSSAWEGLSQILPTKSNSKKNNLPDLEYIPVQLLQMLPLSLHCGSRSIWDLYPNPCLMGTVTKGHRIYRHYPPSELKTNQTTKQTNKQTATEFLQQSYSEDNSTTESSYSYCCYNHCVCSLSSTDRRLFTLVKGKQNDQIAKLVDVDIWSCLDSLCPCS